MPCAPNDQVQSLKSKLLAMDRGVLRAVWESSGALVPWEKLCLALLHEKGINPHNLPRGNLQTKGLGKKC